MENLFIVMMCILGGLLFLVLCLALAAIGGFFVEMAIEIWGDILGKR